MANIVRITGYASLPVIWMDDRERQRQSDACDELVGAACHLDISQPYARAHHLTLEHKDAIASYPAFEALLVRDLPIPFQALRLQVEFEVDYDKAEITSSDPVSNPITDGLRQAVVLHEIRDQVINCFRDLMLATNIAKPGSLHLKDIAAFAEGLAPYLTRGYLHAFSDARDRAIELRWPTFQDLSILSVWSWLDGLKATAIPGAKRLRRAVAALTHLFDEHTRDENSLGLVWALAGLESIYGEENIGSKAQLLRKSEALLGVRTDNKSKFSWMYDYRSRLLHGDVDLSPAFDSRWLPRLDDFDEETYECQKLAIAVLLATVQHLCARDAYAIDFQYQPLYGSA